MDTPRYVFCKQRVTLEPGRAAKNRKSTKIYVGRFAYFSRDHHAYHSQFIDIDPTH